MDIGPMGERCGSLLCCKSRATLHLEPSIDCEEQSLLNNRCSSATMDSSKDFEGRRSRIGQSTCRADGR